MEKQKQRVRGFTLIEVMIVVAIIGILSALAIPDFTAMMIKAKQSEARTNLGAIYTCQMVYFATNNVYAGGPGAFGLINWRPESDLVMKYTYVLDGSIMIGQFGTNGLPTTEPSSALSFQAIAISNLDHDPSPDIWSVNQDRRVDNMVSDVVH